MGDSETTTQGYLLLTLQDVIVEQVYEGQRIRLAEGELYLEGVALPIDPRVGRQQANPFATTTDLSSSSQAEDLWLVVRVGENFELPLLPSHVVHRIPGGLGAEGGTQGFSVSFNDKIPGAHVEILIPPPRSNAKTTGWETFEILLIGYGCLRGSDAKGLQDQEAIPSPLTQSALARAGVQNPQAQGPVNKNVQNLRVEGQGRPELPRQQSGGHLVLVDDSTGDVMGEIDQQVDVDDDGRLAAQDEKGEHSPVYIDFGPISQGLDSSPISVRSVAPEDMDDWMLKGAHYLSKGILAIGNNVSDFSTSAAERYIRNTQRYSEPVKFSPTTKAGIRTVHNVTATGIRVTRKTLDAVTDALGGAVQRVAEPVVEEAREDWQTLRGTEPNTTGSPSGKSSPTGSRPSTSGSAAFKDPPSYSEKPANGSSYSQSGAEDQEQEQASRPKRSFWKRAIIAADVIGTSLEASAQKMLGATGDAAANAAGHKYGPEAERATRLLGGSARNATLVFVDLRGVARKTIFKSAKRGAKGVFTARMADGSEVVMADTGDGQLAVAPANDQAAAHTVATNGQSEGYDISRTEQPVVGRVVGGSSATAEKSPAATQQLGR